MTKSLAKVTLFGETSKKGSKKSSGQSENGRQGSVGYCLKSGLRFSRNAFPPSWASSR